MPKGGNNKLSQEDFITRAKMIHGDLYDYSFMEYKHSHTKINVRCIRHNAIFEVLPSNHIRKMEKSTWNPNGCPTCGKEKVIARNKANLLDQNIAFEKLQNIHGDQYIYKSEYMGSHQKILINCQVHGDFEQEYSNHLRGSGCPKCKNSKGEKIIEKFLLNNNIAFIRQKQFEDCLGDRKRLLFDFYIPNCSTIIEYDGEQHFRPIVFHKNMSKETANEMFIQTLKYDAIKNSYCDQKGIKMIRISFKELKNHANKLTPILHNGYSLPII